MRRHRARRVQPVDPRDDGGRCQPLQEQNFCGRWAPRPTLWGPKYPATEDPLSCGIKSLARTFRAL
jgi:hypothetical protein